MTRPALYVQCEGALFKFAADAVVTFDNLHEGKRLAAEYDYRTGKWSKLPKSLFQMEQWDVRLTSSANGVEVIDAAYL